MKSLRQSAIFWTGVFGLIFLLWLWADSFQWRTQAAIRRGPSHDPAQVLVDMGVLEINWDQTPDWHKGRLLLEPYEVDRIIKWRLPAVRTAEVWFPPFYRREFIGSASYRAGPGLTGRTFAPMYRCHVRIPIWMLVTVHVGFFWSLLAIRRRRMARKWLAGLSAAGEEG